MAYQPKSYRKFLAGSVSAALVATAVGPVVANAASFSDVNPNDPHAANINALVEKGYIKGYEDGTFKPYNNVTRGQVAKIFARILKDAGVQVPADKKAFDDVPVDSKDQELVEAAAIVKAAGVMTGSNGKLNPAANMTREQMAKVLVEAFKLTKPANFTSKITDLDKADASFRDYIQTLEANKVTVVTEFNPKGTVSRAAFASFVKRAMDAQEAAKPAKVEKVSAINPTTLKVEGENLKNLKADQISVEGNTVTAVTPATDGKSATVTLGTALTVNKEYKATVTVDGVAKEFTFTFDFTVTSVSLDEKAYDDDTANQALTFKVNGETATADSEWLRQAGYSVKFYAVDSNNVAAPIFAGGTSESTTGVLDSDIATTGDYTVEVQIIKDGKVVVSDKATITIADLESTATAINSVTFTNYGADYSDDNGTNDDFAMNSTTLVTGESAEITGIKGNAAGKTDVALPVASAEVKSSNPAVISVNGQTITANAAGTATITVKIGTVTKTINFTVTNTARKVAKVTPSESTVKVVVGATRKINVTAVDQYNDPIAVATGDVVESIPKNASGTDLVTVGTSGDNELQTSAADGKHSGFEVTGAAKGTGTVLFKGKDGKVLGQIAVTITDRDNFTSSKLELVYDTESTDNVLVKGKATDDTVKYQVSKFNSEGAYNGAMPLALAQDNDNDGVVDTGFFPAAPGSYYVISSKPSVATVAVSGSELTVTAVAKGTADIVIYDENGFVKHKFTVTVTEDPVAVTKVNFKPSATIDYAGKVVDIKDFLDVRTDTGKDPIVYGVENTAATIAKVRLDSNASVNDENGNSLTATTAAPVLYIDANDSGARDAGEVVLGVLTATPLSGEQIAGMTAGTPIDLLGGATPTASKDKGTLLFRVIDDANADGTYAVTETIATTTLNIDVK